VLCRSEKAYVCMFHWSGHHWLQNQLRRSCMHLSVVAWTTATAYCPASVTIYWRSFKPSKILLRIVTGTSKNDHVTSVLRDLHWLSIRKWIQFKIAVIVFKSLHGLTSPCLDAYCVLVRDCNPGIPNPWIPAECSNPVIPGLVAYPAIYETEKLSIKCL